MHRYLARVIVLALMLGLAACSSENAAPPRADGTPLLAFDPASAPRSMLLAEAVPAPMKATGPRARSAETVAIAADELFDWAEGVLPAIFGGTPPTQALSPFTFRYYEGSGTYLAVLGSTVLALGPVTGGQVAVLGELQSFACVSRPAGCGVPLAGLVARGPALGSAAVTVTDPAGAAVCQATSDGNGRFACNLPASARGPFALRALADGLQLSSVAPSAYPANTNITPLTTLLVSRLVPSGNPADLAAALATTPALSRPAALQGAAAQIQQILAPVISATADSTDLLKGVFTAGDSPHARLLSSLQVSIRPEATAANIEITVKARPADEGSAPLTLSFSSADPAPPVLPAGSVTVQSLPQLSIDTQIADFFARANSCYGLPLAQRIRNVAAGAPSAVGTAADVLAPVCRQLFVDDDPAGYLENGHRVGLNASGMGAFPGLFRESATGVRFEAPALQFQRANGDVLVSFRARATDGSTSFPAPLTLRSQAGALKAVGNQAGHDIIVRPWFDDREFMPQPEFSYFSTGYSVLIRNMLDSGGASIYKQVTVTNPQGAAKAYVPRPGRTYLTSTEKSCCSSQRIGSAYQNPATAGSPADRDTGLLHIYPQLGDEAIRAIPDQGVWRFDIEFSDGSRPTITQSVRTMTRAPTIGEIRKLRLFQFTQAYKDELATRVDLTGGNAFTFGAASASNPNVFVVGTASGGPGWLVQDAAVPAPTFVTIYGQNGVFDEGIAVSRSTTRTTVSCLKTAAHCSAATGVRQFTEGGRVHTIELSVVTEQQMSYIKSLNLYRLSSTP